MAVGDSYFSRFTIKFVEISAAGVATAVSGFVVAHFAGYMGGPTTTAMQAASRPRAQVSFLSVPIPRACETATGQLR